MRGLAPAPPVSLATPRGQGSPLRFDTQPTGWSVGSATRRQGGIRKDCSAALLNLYKASPLTPFRFPGRPAVQVLAGIPGELPGESPAVQVSAKAPGGLPGESPAMQGLANVPGRLPGESPAVQVSANVPGRLPGESPAVQGLANVPGRLPGESPAVQVSANVPGRLPGESPAVQGLAAVAETHDGLIIP